MKINVFEASFSQIQISLCMSFRSEVMVCLSPGRTITNTVESQILMSLGEGIPSIPEKS